MELDKEYQVYKNKKDSLIEQGHAGKFVVIKDDQIFDIYLTYEDALRQGLKEYGNVSFLIKEITTVEKVNYFFHGVDLTCQASV